MGCEEQDQDMKEGFLKKEWEGTGWDTSAQGLAEAGRQAWFPRVLPQLALAKASLLINLGDANCFCSESDAFYRFINS